MSVTGKVCWDKTVEVKGWIISIDHQNLIALCTRRYDGKTFIVKPNSESIRRLPESVIKALRKDGFLETWKEVKIMESVKRLHEISLKVEKLKSYGVL